MSEDEQKEDHQHEQSPEHDAAHERFSEKIDAMASAACDDGLEPQCVSAELMFFAALPFVKGGVTKEEFVEFCSEMFDEAVEMMQESEENTH